MAISPQPTVPPPTKLLTADQVAKRLQVDVMWVYSACKRGLLPHVRVGLSGRGQYRIKESDLEAFLAARSHPAKVTKT
jgi:excisionase family DNA binding protein